LTQRADFFRETAEKRRKMTNWRDSNILLANGARSKRSNPNFDDKEEKRKLRKLVLLQGGNPEQLTHQPSPRRGSRGGTKRRSKQECLAEQQEKDLADWRTYSEHAPEEPGAAADAPNIVVRLDDFRPGAGKGNEVPELAAVPVQNGIFPDLYWSSADAYSDAAVAARRAEEERDRASQQELRAFRQSLEKAVKQKQDQQEELARKMMGASRFLPHESGQEYPVLVSEPCTTRLRLGPEPAGRTPEAEAPRPSLQASHARLPARTEKKKAQKKPAPAGKLTLVKKVRDKQMKVKAKDGPKAVSKLRRRARKE